MTVTPRIAVDASNLREGGSLQVAVSFLEELALLTRSDDMVARFPWLPTVHIRVSREVHEQMSEDSRRQLSCDISKTTWRDLAFRPWAKRGERWDVSFTIFGPSYGADRAARTIVGFADGTSVYPPPAEMNPLPRAKRLRSALRGKVSRTLHKRADVLVVETEDLKQQLVRRLGASPSNIEVVPNAINGALFQPDRWKSVMPPPRPDLPPGLLICYVCRSHPHKNLEFLAHVQAEFDRLKVGIRFVVTLNPREWEGMSAAFRASVLNVGSLSIEQIPTLYRNCDAAIFPSLLEASSAAPLEALAMNLPLFASDRPYVRERCGEAPYYFDPTDPSKCAALIAETMRDVANVQAHVEAGSRIVAGLPDAKDRARRYVEIIGSQVAHLESLHDAGFEPDSSASTASARVGQDAGRDG